MLQFNELRIDEHKNLIVDVSVLDMVADPEKQITIDHILVGIGCKEETTDFIAYINDEDSFFTRVDRYNSSIRGFRLVVSMLNDDAYKNIIYVMVSVDPRIDVGCSHKDKIEGYAYDKCLIMDKLFDFLKKSPEPCYDITDFANYLVQIEGVELALEGGNFALANKFWKKFFMNNNLGVSSSNCGCR